MASIMLLKSMLFASVLQKSKRKKKLKSKKPNASKAINLNMCRICNKQKGEISIFGNNIDHNISDEIKNFSGVIINENDNFPKKICQACLDLLNGCIVFRDMCQATNKILMDLSVKKEATNNNEETLKEDTFKEDSDDSFNPFPKCFEGFGNYTERNKDTSELRKHQTESSSKKIFLCDICGKTTKSNANLLVHMGTHGSSFPFNCDQCPYKSRTMDLLKVHKRSHMAEKPFKCTLCPKATTTSSNLAKHMRYVHSKTRPFNCMYCDKAFSYQFDMRRHIRDIHLREGTVKCNICFKKFNTKKILHGHRWKIHKIKGERHGRLPSYLQCKGADENQLNEEETA